MSDDERIAMALSALAEVTEPGSVGALVDATVPVPGVIDLRFATTQRAYAGWFWTVSTSAVEDVEPTVLELQLLPGDGALVAPSWVPWEERLAEWRRTHADDDAADDGAEDEDDDDLDDDEGLDDGDDLDAVVDEVLDDGDVDGVDVDASAAADGPEGDDEGIPAPLDGEDAPPPARPARRRRRARS